MHVAHHCHGRWHRFDIALFGQDHAQALKQVARMENWCGVSNIPWSSIWIRANLLDKPIYRIYRIYRIYQTTRVLLLHGVRSGILLTGRSYAGSVAILEPNKRRLWSTRSQFTHPFIHLQQPAILSNPHQGLDQGGWHSGGNPKANHWNKWLAFNWMIVTKSLHQKWLEITISIH